MSGFGGVRHRVRYRFDNLLARGTSAVLVWLGVVTFFAILVSSFLLLISGISYDGSGGNSWLEDAWQSMLRVMDPGTMAGDVGWGRRILALLVTIFGLLVAGTLIGIIAAGVEDRIETMRRGRSVVIENDHIVVLGNSDRIPVLVDQLTLANESAGGRTIVIMIEGDPADTANEVSDVVVDTRGCRLVYRSGDSTRRGDLELVRLHAARTVVVLAGDGGDVRAVKSVLAVGAELGGFDRVPVVVELSSPDTAAILRHACGDLVHTMLPEQAAARTTAVAMQGPGMARVVDELLNFRGCDVYVRDDVDVGGRQFGDVVTQFANARPIGRVSAHGDVELNPEPATVFDPGDRLVVFADDRGPLKLATNVPARRIATDRWRPTPPTRAERLLVMGWSPLGAQVIADWSANVAPGSVLEVVVEPELRDTVAAALVDVDHTIVSTSQTASLVDRLTTLDGADSISMVLLLADETVAADESDAKALLRLTLVDRLVPSDRRPRMLFELRDVDSVPLVTSSSPDDYVISDAVGSSFIAQLAEQPERRAVLLALYADDGASLRTERADRLGVVGNQTAGQIYATCAAAGVIAVGWLASGGATGDLTLNAHVDVEVTLAPDDFVVIVG